jgi:Zn-dependent peptidase ImmA (M78 family)/DNA-binding XRE family transcriptional regulator
MSVNLIGARIKALREERKLSQDELARLFGFKDRQTVSAIETGERRVTAEELLIAVEKLGASLDFFTDPFLLVGEGKFSWRQSRVGLENLKAFERVAGRWIAANRTLSNQIGRFAPILRQTLKLTPKSTFEEAIAAGERFAADFGLGPVPADHLADVMENKLGILVIMVDAIDGVSGAACRLPDLDAVLINRHEVEGRRHFDLAHELFHILTWDTMPPEHIEEATEYSKNRVEQLANNFASAILMPRSVIERFLPIRGDVIVWLSETASALQVTATALKWRLVALGVLDSTQAKKISDAALRNNRVNVAISVETERPKRGKNTTRAHALALPRTMQPDSTKQSESLVALYQRLNNGRNVGRHEPPPLFSRSFVGVIGQAINEGQISVRRTADLLDMNIDDLVDLFATHAVEAPLDL